MKGNATRVDYLELGQRLAAASKPGIIDVVTGPDPESQEHLTLYGERLGRDLRLYNFMVKLENENPAAAWGDIAEVLLVAQKKDPAGGGAERVPGRESACGPLQHPVVSELCRL